MTALTAARSTPQKGDKAVLDQLDVPLKASTKTYKGSLVVIDAGYLAPGRAAVGLVAVGRSMDTYDNSSGSAGAITGAAQRGCFQWGNSSSTDAIAQGNVGSPCYIVDDQTVALTDGGGTRSLAGTIQAVDSLGVWVETPAGSGSAAQRTSLDEQFIAGETLTAKLGFAVVLDGSGNVVVAGAKVAAIGILTNAPASAAVASVRMSGIVTAKAGGNLTPGMALTTDSSGNLVAAYGADPIVAVAMATISSAATGEVYVMGATGAPANKGSIVCIPVTLAGISGTGQVVGAFTPGFAGRILKTSFVNTTVATTGSKAATLQPRIGGTNTTGGALALTSANQTPLGNVVAGSSVTAANTFAATDTIDVQSSGVTAFVEGAGLLMIHLG